MSQRDDHRYARSKKINIETVFLLVMLGGARPSNAFWNWVLPDGTDEFNGYTPNENYFGLVPDSICNRLDRILIDWLSEKASNDETSTRLQALMESFADCRRDDTTTPLDETDEKLRNHFESTLRHIHENIPDPMYRPKVVRAIEKIRGIYYPGISRSEDDSSSHPIGFG